MLKETSKPPVVSWARLDIEPNDISVTWKIFGGEEYTDHGYTLQEAIEHIKELKPSIDRYPNDED